MPCHRSYLYRSSSSRLCLYCGSTALILQVNPMCTKWQVHRLWKRKTPLSLSRGCSKMRIFLFFHVSLSTHTLWCSRCRLTVSVAAVCWDSAVLLTDSLPFSLMWTWRRLRHSACLLFFSLPAAWSLIEFNVISTESSVFIRFCLHFLSGGSGVHDCRHHGAE